MKTLLAVPLRCRSVLLLYDAVVTLPSTAPHVLLPLSVSRYILWLA